MSVIFGDIIPLRYQGTKILLPMFLAVHVKHYIALCIFIYLIVV